ncbi:MAG: cyclic nucleotide-binding protein [Acidobacteriaceae bacterium]|nr:cyclic nucleotide-binding protein [Acidobacteriaceae bacterium]
MSATLAMLREVKLFALLDDQESESLCALMETSHFDKGDTVFNAGDAGDSIYIVRSGRVEVYIENYEGHKIILRENETGDVFGDISLLDGGPRTATAVAVEDTEVLSLDRDNLLELVTKHPHAGLDLLTVMGQRLRATNELLRTQVSRNANEEEEEMLTFGQRIADKVASFGGSWTFIITFGVFLLVWMSINSMVLLQAAKPGSKPFDEYPFILLNLILSTLAALQAPVIMMSQNRQASKDRLQADLDYQVNLKAELEVAQLHGKVDRIYETMQAQFAKAEKAVVSSK